VSAPDPLPRAKSPGRVAAGRARAKYRIGGVAWTQIPEYGVLHRVFNETSYLRDNICLEWSELSMPQLFDAVLRAAGRRPPHGTYSLRRKRGYDLWEPDSVYWQHATLGPRHPLPDPECYECMAGNH
jgi:hypothetical protein